MITTIKLINIYIISHSYLLCVCACVCVYVCVCEMKILKVNSLSKFQVYNTELLTIVTILHIRFPELIYPL